MQVQEIPVKSTPLPGGKTVSEPRLSWSASGFLFIDKVMTAFRLPKYDARAITSIDEARDLVASAYLRGWRDREALLSQTERPLSTE